MTDLVMPRLSDSMEEGTILQWLKSVGDEVAVGDELVEIETDKANMVYEADAAGTLVEIVAEEGDTLPIGEVIARVGDSSEVSDGSGSGTPAPSQPSSTGSATEDSGHGTGFIASDRGTAAEPEGTAKEPAAPAPSQISEPATPATSSDGGAASTSDGAGRVKASPLAKRMAADAGVDLGALQGSGPGGRVIKKDVEAAASGESAAPAPGAARAAPAPKDVGAAKGEVETVELTKLQQTVSRRMAESKATAPHFYLTTEIDMTRCVDARAQIKAGAGEDEVVPSFNDMVVKACAMALRENPRANGSYRDGRLELYSRVNVGVAVAAQNALVVPTVFDADQKGLRQIATEVRELAGKVREQKITPPELSGGTFTVSNLGMYGITDFAAVINPPQAAILAVGAITERPVVRAGEITTAQMMSATLASDHRILYGAEGAEFLAAIRRKLEEPVALAL